MKIMKLFALNCCLMYLHVNLLVFRCFGEEVVVFVLRSTWSPPSGPALLGLGSPTDLQYPMDLQVM